MSGTGTAGDLSINAHGTERAILRRDRVLVLSSLTGIVALAWLATFYLGAGLDMMMGADLVLACALWLVMMVAMMTPSVSPTVLMYASILRSRDRQPLLAAGIFLLGYLLVWSVFSVTAALAQFGLREVISQGALVGGLVLVAAGIFQFTPLKHACLNRCRSPQGFFMTRWREGARGALAMGLQNGVYCFGCCWLLMSLLLVTGAMNVLWMAGLAIFVLAEKVVPAGLWLSRAAGLALVGAGAWMVIAGF